MELHQNWQGLHCTLHWGANGVYSARFLLMWWRCSTASGTFNSQSNTQHPLCLKHDLHFSPPLRCTDFWIENHWDGFKCLTKDLVYPVNCWLKGYCDYLAVISSGCYNVGSSIHKRNGFLLSWPWNYLQQVTILSTRFYLGVWNLSKSGVNENVVATRVQDLRILYIFLKMNLVGERYKRSTVTSC